MKLEGDIKHLVVASFKEGVALGEILNGIEALASEIHAVKSFEWGEVKEGNQQLTQGFTHAFSFTFSCMEDFNAFQAHPLHLRFSEKFSTTIDRIAVLDFPAVLVRAPQPPPALTPLHVQPTEQT